MRYLFLITMFSLPCSLALGQTFASGNQQVPLLELYTSEGCSSCPPADRWFSRLVEDGGLWSAYVPIAFHVDYWNHLGWDDPFAEARFSQRQRDYHRQGHTRGVYTPGVMSAGSEWHRWRRSALPPASSGTTIGSLTLAVDSGRFSAEFRPASNTQVKDARLTVAVLGFGLQSAVQSGENRGRILKHDFVVLGMQKYRSNDGSWQGQLPSAQPQQGEERQAVVAWLSYGNQLQPQQATGGWLTAATD